MAGPLCRAPLSALGTIVAVFTMHLPVAAQAEPVTLELAESLLAGTPGFTVSTQGDRAAGDLVAGCPGYIAANTPAFAFSVPESLSGVRVSLEGPDIASLMVEMPTGLFQCVPANEAGTAQLALDSPASGRYALWPAAASEETTAQARLILSSLEGGSAIVQAEPDEPVRGPASRYGEAFMHPDMQGRQTLLVAPLVSTGSARELAPHCTGSVGLDQPDATVTLEDDAHALSLYAESEADTVIAVQAPDGTWLCNDDTLGFNPAVTMEPASAGVYSVYVGGFARGAAGEFTLNASIGEPDWSDEGPSSPWQDDLIDDQDEEVPLNADADPAFGRLAVPADASEPPATATISLAAEDPWSDEPGEFHWASSLGFNCAGLIDASRPDVVVDVDNPVSGLTIYAIAEMDGTMVIQKPDGEIVCNDDFQTLHPGIVFDQAEPGAYAVWVGEFSGSGGQAIVGATLGTPNWTASPGDDPSATAQAPRAQDPIVDFPTGLSRNWPGFDDPETVLAPFGDMADTIRNALEAGERYGWPEFVEVVGSPVIEAEDDGFRVTFPSVMVGPLDGERIEISPLVLTLSPTDGNAFELTAALPEIMPIFDRRHEQSAQLSIEGRELSARYDDTISGLSHFDLDFADLVLRPINEDGPLVEPQDGLPADQLTVERIVGQSLAEPQSDGLWHGESLFEFVNSEITAMDGSRASVGLFQMTFDMSDTDVSALLDVQNTFFGLTGDESGSPTPHPDAMDQALDTVLSSFGNASWGLRISDFESVIPGDAMSVRFDRAGMGFAVEGVSSDRASLSVAAHHAGLVLDGFDVADDVLAGDASLSLTLTDLPGAPIWNDYAFMLLMEPLMALDLLTERGTSVSLSGQSNAEIGGFKLDAALRAASEAAWGVNGHLKLDMRGLAEMTADLGETEPDVAAGLAMIQLMGVEQEDGTRRYDLSVDDDGIIRLNGVDITILVRLMDQF